MQNDELHKCHLNFFPKNVSQGECNCNCSNDKAEERKTIACFCEFLSEFCNNLIPLIMCSIRAALCMAMKGKQCQKMLTLKCNNCSTHTHTHIVQREKASYSSTLILPFPHEATISIALETASRCNKKLTTTLCSSGSRKVSQNPIMNALLWEKRTKRKTSLLHKTINFSPLSRLMRWIFIIIVLTHSFIRFFLFPLSLTLRAKAYKNDEMFCFLSFN